MNGIAAGAGVGVGVNAAAVVGADAKGVVDVMGDGSKAENPDED